MASKICKPKYSELPMEMILHIYQYLGHMDRQSAGATCRRWYEALCHPEMNRNVMAIFYLRELSDNSGMLRSFNASARPIRAFIFDYIRIGAANVFFKKISTLARSVTFRNIDICLNDLWIIIQQLKHLESLTIGKIDDCDCRSVHDFAVGSESPLANIKRLSLVSQDAFNHALLSSIRALESLTLKSYKDVVFTDMIDGRLRTEIDFDLNILVPHLSHLRELQFVRSTTCSASLLRLYEMSEGRLNLRRLRMGKRYSVDTKLCAFLKTQRNLVRLDLAERDINDDCMTTITDCLTLLEELNISRNSKITDAGAIKLKKLKYLKRLILSWCSQITDDGIKQGIAAEENTTLRDLNLRNSNLTSEAITAIAKNLKGLRILNLSQNVIAVDEQAVQTIIEHMPKLTTLSLSHCSNITDTALTGISKKNLKLMKRGIAINANERQGFSIANLRGLQKLDLSECPKITDLTLQFGLKLKELRVLDLTFCRNVTPNGFKSLVQNTPAIECLSVDGSLCTNHRFLQSVKNLKRLKLFNCDDDLNSSCEY